MKKYFKSAVVAAVAALAVVNVYKAQTKVELSDLQIKNVEALANGEGNINCDNRSGYRQWNTKPSNSEDKEKAFYDCCYVLRYGYSPSDNCIY